MCLGDKITSVISVSFPPYSHYLYVSFFHFPSSCHVFFPIIPSLCLPFPCPTFSHQPTFQCYFMLFFRSAFRCLLTCLAILHHFVDFFTLVCAKVDDTYFSDCTYVCMYTCIYVSVYPFLYLSMYINQTIYLYIYRHTHTHPYILSSLKQTRTFDYVNNREND